MAACCAPRALGRAAEARSLPPLRSGSDYEAYVVRRRKRSGYLELGLRALSLLPSNRAVARYGGTLLDAAAARFRPHPPLSHVAAIPRAGHWAVDAYHLTSQVRGSAPLKPRRGCAPNPPPA